MRYASAYEYLFLLDANASIERIIMPLDHDEPTRASKGMQAAGLQHFMFASSLASAGESQQAEEEFAKSVLLAPDFPLARYQLGFLQFILGRIALAQLTWQPLLSPKEETPESNTLMRFVQGFSALANDDLDKALAFFETGLSYRFENQALLDDVRKIMERVRGTVSDTSRNLGPLHDTPAPAIEPSDTHVLLNGYLRSIQ